MTVTKSSGLLTFGKVYAKRRDILGVDLREEDVRSSETGLSYPKPRTLNPKCKPSTLNSNSDLRHGLFGWFKCQMGSENFGWREKWWMRHSSKPRSVGFRV